MAYASTQEILRRVLSKMAPPPKMSISEWADAYRILSPESSAQPGKWRTSVVEYLREPMDMVGKPGVREIVMMTSSQVAKSSFLENVIGYFIHYDPCPILHVSPTLASMKMFSKERLSPMIRDTVPIRKLVKDARSRDSDNTIETKKFPGGNLALVGANSPTGLASRPVRVVLADEVDRFERSAGTEGDPLKLAIRRTITFWNRVIIYVSTPGNKGESRIEEAYELSDKRRRWCLCPDCNKYQTLKWSQVKWTDHDPETAYYECEHCGSAWDDVQRNLAVKNGEWRAERKFNGIVGYHLSQIYSPFARLADGVREFLECRTHPELYKTWVNTFLGETWEERGERLEWSDIADHRSEWDQPVPEDVTLITIGADVQDDRVELERVGWGNDFRSWSLGYVKVYGDPSTREFWQEVRSVVTETVQHPIFGELSPRAICMDSGGHYTQEVYKFTSSVPRCVPIRGVGGAGKPFVGKPSKANLGGVQVFNLGVDTGKEIVTARMRVHDPDSPGYCHFPKDRGDDYFRGLTAEKLVTRFHKGFKRQEWVKVNHQRNEPFDCRVYATAALEMLQVDLGAQRRAMMRQVMQRFAQSIESAVPKEPAEPARPRSNFVNRWAEG